MCTFDNFQIRGNAHSRVFSVKERSVVRLFFLWDVVVIATINNNINSNSNLHDLVVQMVKVLIITVIIVLLLLVVVLLLSPLLYQDHYLEAAVESCQEKKAFFKSEQNF